jgi:hypothetical protein
LAHISELIVNNPVESVNQDEATNNVRAEAKEDVSHFAAFRSLTSDLRILGCSTGAEKINSRLLLFWG